METSKVKLLQCWELGAQATREDGVFPERVCMTKHPAALLASPRRARPRLVLLQFDFISAASRVTSNPIP